MIDSNKIYLLAVFLVVFVLAISSISPGDREPETLVLGKHSNTKYELKDFVSYQQVLARSATIKNF